MIKVNTGCNCRKSFEAIKTSVLKQNIHSTDTRGDGMNWDTWGFVPTSSLPTAYTRSPAVRVDTGDFLSWTLVSSSVWWEELVDDPSFVFYISWSSAIVGGDPNWPHFDLMTPGNICLPPPLFTLAFFWVHSSLNLVGPQAKQACLPLKHIEVGVDGPLAPAVPLLSFQLDGVSQMYTMGLHGVWEKCRMLDFLKIYWGISGSKAVESVF